MTLKDIEQSPEYRDLATAKLAVGDAAFPFTLPRLERGPHGDQESADTVTLTDYAGVRPVALSFGSYT